MTPPPSGSPKPCRCSFILLASVLLAVQSAWARPPYVAGEVLVKFKPVAGQQAAKARAGLAGAAVRRSLAGGWQLIRLPAGMGVPAGVEYYLQQPDVLYAEPNYLVRRRGVPDDPKWDKLWGLAKIGAPEAWDQTTGSTEVVVGVVDTGIDYLHPDLAPNLWHNPGEIPDNGVDDDLNGYVDDVYGIDVVHGTGDPMDDEGHGTHTAGTIGAAGNNGLGVVGVNWRVQLLALKIFTTDDFASHAQIVEAYNYAVALRQSGVNLRVLNNSWGGDYPSRALYEAISSASDAGILIVCSAGNDRQNSDCVPSYPEAYDCEGVISVAASTASDEPAYFSNYGEQTVDLAAPGVSILNTFKGGPFYAALQGTSMAAPHVSGAAALLLARRLNLAVSQLKALLLDTVDRLPAWEGKVASGGRLNVAKAMQRLTEVGLGELGDAASRSQAARLAQPSALAPVVFPRVTCVSRNSQGQMGNNDTSSADISADGRWVVFASDASNLVASDTYGKRNIFLHDRASGATILVSQAPNGEPANGDSDDPAISADGRIVVFASEASNLADVDDNGASDIFVYDVAARSLELVSANAWVIGNAASVAPAISADGRYVAFASDANNLLPGDFNERRDIVVVDRQNHTLTRASVNSSGQSANSENDEPALSADGRYVAFHSFANNLVPGDSNEAWDVFVYDRQTRQTQRVSVSSTGVQGDSHSAFPALSGDGRFVVFISLAGNLAVGGASGKWGVFLRDLQQGTIVRASVGPGGLASEADCYDPVLSADGRFVAFESPAKNLSPGKQLEVWDVYLFDRRTDRASQLTYNAWGFPGRNNSFLPRLSANGRHVVLISWADNLAPGDGNAAMDAFVIDRGAATPDLMLRNPHESTFTGAGLVGRQIAQRRSQSVTAGQVAVYELRLENAGPSRQSFVIKAAGPAEGWATEYFDAFAGGNRIGAAVNGSGWATPPLDPGAGQILRLEVTPANLLVGDRVLEAVVTAAATGAEDAVDAVRAVTSRPFSPPDLLCLSRAADGAPGEGASRGAMLSDDGQTVAFYSEAANLAPADANEDRDVFVFSRTSQQLELVSHTLSGDTGDRRSELVALSADGRYAVFQSYATNLVEGDTNERQDIFLKDRASGLLTRVSVGPDGAQLARGSQNPQLSRDGQFVAFEGIQEGASLGSSRAAGRAWDVALFDRATGQLTWVSRGPSGQYADGDSSLAALTPNGAFVLFCSYASNLVPHDANEDLDVFVYDQAAQRVELVSANAAGQSGNAASTPRAISNDGRYVVFASEASDVVPNDTNSASDVFLFDRATRTMSMVSVDAQGGAGDADSSSPSLSPDGRWIVFVSSANNLVPYPGEACAQVFLCERPTGRLRLISADAQGQPGNGDSSYPQISPDGRWVGFMSQATNLVPGDTNQTTDVFLYDTRAGTLRCASMTRAGVCGSGFSAGGSFSADGRFYAFRSWGANLVGERIREAACQVLVLDLAAFQPDSIVRRADSLVALGSNQFGPAAQHVEQPVAPGAPKLVHVAMRNNGNTADRFTVAATAGDQSWSVRFYDAATGEDITVSITGPGWQTASVPRGNYAQLTIELRKTAVGDVSKDITITATSLNDPAKSDIVVVTALADVDSDGLPDDWERRYFGSTAAANNLSDYDQDGASDLAECLAGTDPTDPRSALSIIRLERDAQRRVSLRWPSATNRYYAVQRAAILSGAFTNVISSLLATPPENTFLDAAEPDAPQGFYRLRVDCP